MKSSVQGPAMVFVPQRSVPTLADNLAFEIRAAGLRVLRFAREAVQGTTARRHHPSPALDQAPVLAEIRSPLWTVLGGVKDRALTAGKVQNLRMAVRGLDGILVPAGETFSFWKQVGRATRGRGFVAGRELREGCLISSVGGGLCQLSNALYEAAQAAGCEIVERHAHSRVVPGSRAELGRDATVFWNYVDLRFRRANAFRIEARLTDSHLVVTLRAADAIRLDAGGCDGAAPAKSAHDCTSCGQTACRRNNPDLPATEAPATAWLVDGARPEFVRLFQAMAKKDDALFMPARRQGNERYAWPNGLCGQETRATLATLRRSYDLRKAGFGGTLQARALAADARIARHYAARLSHLHTHAVVAQNLLPHLWLAGALQGRSFSVLMDRLPMDALQERLDWAGQRRPESPTLADFRAPAQIVAAERQALAAARQLYTTHAGIAALLADKAVMLPWAPVKSLPVQRGGKSVLFPASALARKGAYALREAVAGLDIDLIVAGAAREMPGFWGPLPVRRPDENGLPTHLAAVVLPAIVEHQPRTLLAALAAGIPVIATPACGLTPREGLILVPEDDAAALRAALVAVLASV